MMCVSINVLCFVLYFIFCIIFYIALHFLRFVSLLPLARASLSPDNQVSQQKHLGEKTEFGDYKIINERCIINTFTGK